MDSDTHSGLSPAILASAAILNRGSESVRAVLAAEENRFTSAPAALEQLSLGERIPIAIVDGLGAIRYGYPAATQDIDVAIAKDQLEAFIAAAPNYGIKIAWNAPSGWHTLTHGDVEINVVPEGGKARDSAPTTIPGPSKLGVQQGLDYANLPGWIELKLSSGRQKDRAQVVEVMKKNDLRALQAARQNLAQVHLSYLELFDQLLEQAQAEKAQEERRGPAKS
jgi:hypothetical protein